MDSLALSWPEFLELTLDALASLRRVFLGVSAALVVGMILGFTRSLLPPILKRNPIVRFLLDAPKFPPPIAWIPPVILLFGIGEFSAGVIVFIGALSPIFTGTFEGAEALSSVLRDTARSLELRGIEFIRKVLFPATLPHILVGLRNGISMGWMSVIAAEMLSGQSGLGYAIQLDRLNLQYGRMLWHMTAIGVIGWLLFIGVQRLERVWIPWHEKGERRV